VLIGRPNTNRGRQHRIQTVSDRRSDDIGEQRVRAQGQMAPLMLD
jgi:hypothetical protein